MDCPHKKLYTPTENQDLNNTKLELLEIVENVKKAGTSDIFFQYTSKISELLNKHKAEDAFWLICQTNLYILIFYSLSQNEKFKKELIKITLEEKNQTNYEIINLNSKIYINSGISLAFYCVAYSLCDLSEANIVFLREKISNFIKIIVKQSNYTISYSNLCFKLEEIIWNYAYHFSRYSKVNLVTDNKILFKNLQLTRAVAGVSFSTLTIGSSLSQQLKFALEKIDKENFSISKVFSNIYGVTHKIEGCVNHYYNGLIEEKLNQLKNYSKFFIKNNERNSLFIIRAICSGFQYQGDKKFYEIIQAKIVESLSLKNKLLDFGKNNFKAFRGVVEEGDSEWSIKLLLISIKTLGLLNDINSATDKKWKNKTAVFELTEWLRNIYLVFNRNLIEDDWNLIVDYVKQENEEIEWKSTFFTPIEQEYRDENIEKSMEKRLFDKIIKTILGMINTNGGVILIGLVENPSNVVRQEIIKSLIVKNGITFFDINSEFERLGKNLDNVRLQIIDNLKSIAGISQEKFNNLITLEPIQLKISGGMVTIIKICIKKSDRIIPSIRKEGDIIWVSLLKRAQGQTIDVDIRGYI